MKSFRDLPIAKKLIIISLSIFLLPMGIWYAVSMHLVSTELDRNTMDYAQSFNSQIVASLDHFIQDYKAMSVSVLVDNELFTYLDKETRTTTDQVDDFQNMRRVLFRLIQLQPALETASIMMKNGDYVQTGVADVKVDKGALEKEGWFQNIHQNNENPFYLVPAHKTAYWNRRTDQITITFVRKILSSGVRYLGALMIDVDPAAVLNLNEKFSLAKDEYGMEICISDADGRVIYDTRPDVFSEEEDGFYYAKPFGSNYFVLEDSSDELGLRVTTAIPKASMLLDKHYIYSSMATLAIICGVLIIALVIHISHSVTKPLEELSYGMSRLKNGEYITMENDQRSDELGKLIQSYNHMISEMQQLIDRVYVSELRQKDSEIVALQSQINPHMLFNTLESIRMKALVNGDAEVSKMILMLGRMFRTILDSMDKIHVINDELQYTEEYITLLNLREDGRFSFTYEVEEQLLNVTCIPIFFQPLVENCVEHGQCNKDGRLNIRITGHQEGDKAIFTVQDDGQGMNAETMERITRHLQEAKENPNLLLTAKKTNGKNIGMANILMRLRLNDDKNGDVSIVYSNENGTCIRITTSAKEAADNAAV